MQSSLYPQRPYPDGIAIDSGNYDLALRNILPNFHLSLTAFSCRFAHPTLSLISIAFSSTSRESVFGADREMVGPGAAVTLCEKEQLPPSVHKLGCSHLKEISCHVPQGIICLHPCCAENSFLHNHLSFHVDKNQLAQLPPPVARLLLSGDHSNVRQ